jgi:hypothetical protein
MKTQDYIRISCSNGDLDSIIPFDELVISAVENEILVNKNLIVEGDVDWSEIANLIPNDHSSCMELTTDEGSIYISREAKEVPEEWYEILSDKLIEAGIHHKVAATGTIYIKFNDDFDGETKLRIGDHDANGFNFIDIDPDKVEDDFDGFIEVLEDAQIKDDFEDFIYED